jgi:hypothetical protein
MRPAPIPDDDVWDGARRIIIAPPGGDMTDPEISSVEVLADAVMMHGQPGPRLSARCILEAGDLDALAAGGTVWVSFYGGILQPFSVDVLPPADARPYARLEVDFRRDQAPGFRAFLGGIPDGMSAADFAQGCAQALTEMAAEWRAREESGDG